MSKNHAGEGMRHNRAECYPFPKHLRGTNNTGLARSLQVNLPSTPASRVQATSAEGEVCQKQVLFQMHTASLQRAYDIYSTVHVYGKALTQITASAQNRPRGGSKWHYRA